MKIDWSQGSWTNAPENAIAAGNEFWVTAKPESDCWNKTSYGFTHDNGHGLVTDLPRDSAMQVQLYLDYDQNFDQAGLLLFADKANWVKAGVEHSDGMPQAGAVVTAGNSDWSVSRVPEWRNSWVTVRISRTKDAITIRAGVDELRLLRVAPIDSHLNWKCGPMVCVPTRAGLRVRFRNWETSEADASLL